MKKENQKLITGLIIGAAAGSALTIFLQGDNGKKLLSSIKDTAQSTKEELKDGFATAQTSIESIMNKGRRLLEDLKGNKRLTIDEEMDEIFS